MSAPHNPCSRTNAVLAVHLDGDLEPTPPLDREPLGYGFVSDDSLHHHLRECATCQLALQHARRLDATLAAMAGRTVANHAAQQCVSMEALSERLLARATAAFQQNASSSRSDNATTPAVAMASTSDDATVVAASGARLPDNQLPDNQDVAARHGSHQHAAESGRNRHIAPQMPSAAGTWIAAAGILAACFATFLCIDTATAHATEDTARNQGTTSNQVAGTEPESGQVAAPAPASIASEEGILATRGSSLAQHLQAVRNRELPEQGTTAPRELAERIHDRQRDVADRLAAGQQLLRAIRPGSMAAREAADEFFLALAACGDRNQAEIALHGQLLEELRANGAMLVRLEHRLASVPARNERSEAASATAVDAANRDVSSRDASATGDAIDGLTATSLAAIVVAARVENDRLDLALRRALRRNGAVAEVLAGALRCGIRVTGATELLLDCWHDEVAIDRQADSPQWAEFWFRGQATTTFDQLSVVLSSTHSMDARVRCLLAMGCVHDHATLPHLLAGLASPRRAEAYAAACGLASLPHRVLKPIVAQAKQQD